MKTALPELQKQVIKYYNKNTRSLTSSRLSVSFTKDMNLAYSIGHGTILNPKVDNSGNFSGLLFDKYDFKWNNYNKGMLDKTTFYNNAADILQNTHIIKNYYIIVPISFKLR